MRKKIVAVSMVMAMMLATACGKENSKETTTEVAVSEEAQIVGQFCGVDLTYDPSEYLTLPDYTQIEVTEYEPTEDEVETQLLKYVSSWTHNEEVEKDTVEDGDIVLIDYVGSVDGVEFEGGTASDYELEIGSNAFIDGFESSLIGAKNKEKTTITVTFPDEYSRNPDLQGKEAQFEVNIKGIYKEVSYDMDDASVAENTEYSTVDEYAAVIKEEMKRNYVANMAWQVLFEKCQFSEVPTVAVQGYKVSIKKQFEQNLLLYGMTMDSYLESYGYTQEEFDAEMEATATDYVKQDILLLCLAMDNNISISDEEMTTWGNENYASLGYGSAEELFAYMDTTNLKLYIISEKVLDIMEERAVIVPAEETTSEEAGSQETESEEEAISEESVSEEEVTEETETEEETTEEITSE